MKSFLRLYVNTSKGNDPFLFRQLTHMHLKPRFDQHLHSFYFDANFHSLFDLSFHSLLAENMYVQIGKPFPATSEPVFQQHLQKMQFKNYLPLKRGLVENMALDIIVRDTQYPLTNNVMTSFLQNALHKQIIARQYHKEIVGPSGANSKDSLLPYYDLREIVQRKWQEQDHQRQKMHMQIVEQQQQRLLLEYKEKNQSIEKGLIGRRSQIVSKRIRQQRAQIANKNKAERAQLIEQSMQKQLASLLPFHPQMTLYVRKNMARLLLKINIQEMYKHGWKKRVGWAPVRQSIAAAVVSQTNLLTQQQDIRIWDPFCGSGTIPMASAALFHSVAVRKDLQSNFNWQHWSIYKEQYLQEYRQIQAQKQAKKKRLGLICSDISFQAVNYTIENMTEMLKNVPKKSNKIQSNQTSKNIQKEGFQQNLVKRLRPTDQIYQLKHSNCAVLCGDFQKISKNVLSYSDPVSIITNLPYTNSRSKQHIPLSQLTSIYRRFSTMLVQNKDKIANVFILINNGPQQVSNPNHFLSVSNQKWHSIASFQSGGLPIGLYAWSQNALKNEYVDHIAIYNSLNSQRQQLERLPEKDIQTHLVKYRQRIKAIRQKNYYLPNYLLRPVRSGYKRVLQKKRRRHLLRAYQLFARRKSEMQAFVEYSRKKLEIKMLRRGNIWRKRNVRLLAGTDIVTLEKELKNQFEGRISEAIKQSEQKQAVREAKQKERKKVEQKKKAAKEKEEKRLYEARNIRKIHYKRQLAERQAKNRRVRNKRK